MAGRGFLDVARDVVKRPTEFHRRAAAIHAYYALFLECRDALTRWGCKAPPRDRAHAWTRIKFVYASDVDLKTIAKALDDLVQLRNRASYDLTFTVSFSSSQRAQNAIDMAADSLAILDQIEADPARLKAAIASLPP